MDLCGLGIISLIKIVIFNVNTIVKLVKGATSSAKSDFC